MSEIAFVGRNNSHIKLTVENRVKDHHIQAL